MHANLTLNSYQVNLSVGSGGSASASSINVYYGLTNTFTVTPNAGYYLESLSCNNGYTASGFTTGTSSTGVQTVTISNNNKLNGATCTIKFKAKEVSYGSYDEPLWTDGQHNWGYDDNTYDEDVLTYTFSNISQYNYITVYGSMSGEFKNGDWSLIVRINKEVKKVSNGEKIALNGADTVDIGYWYYCEEDGSWEGSNASVWGWAVLSY